MTAGARTPGRALEWIDSRLNAILVKDVRAWLRSKKFLIVFFVALALIQIVTLVVTAIPDPEMGRTLYLILSSGLAVVLVGVLPFLMQDRFTDELASGSTELALISRMTPGQLVRGKIMSGVAATLLFFSAAGPPLTIAYMLGGVDLIMLLYTTGLLLFSAVMSMIIALLIVSISGKRKLKFLGLIPIGAGVALCILIVALAELFADEGAHLEPTFWLVHVVIAAYVSLFAVFLYTVAVSRLSFEADNRDLRPRMALSALTVVPMAVAALIAAASTTSWKIINDPEEFLVIFIIVSMVVFAFGSFFIMSTPDRLSARVKSHASRSGLLRLFLYPGPGRLYAYLLSHVIFFGAVSLLPHFLTGADGEVTFGLLTASLVTAPTIMGGCTMVHAFLKQTVFFKTRKLPRGLTVAILAVVWMGAAIPFGVLIEALDFDEFLFVFHPLTAIIYAADEESALAFMVAIVCNSLVLLPSILYWLSKIRWAVTEEALLSMDRARGGRGEEPAADG